MTRRTAYGQYQDVDGGWLDRLPASWRFAKLGYRYAVDLGKMLDEKRQDGANPVHYLRNQDVHWDSINIEELPVMDIGPGERARYTVRSGDLLVCEGGDVGRAAIWQGDDGKVGYQKALHRLRPLEVDREHPRYMLYVLAAAKAFGAFVDTDAKATIAHLPAEKFRQYRFPRPSFTEQASVASFLDRETARIDALIEKKTRFIALLREKRQALITKAVTRGLEAGWRMKDSGVEWLGQIPAHWTTSPLKHLVRFASGGTPSKETSQYWDGDVPWASAKDLKVDLLLDTEDHITVHAVDVGAASLIPAGSVLVVVRGMILARTFPVTVAGVPMAINQDLKAVIAGPKMHGAFLAYLLRGTAQLSLARLEEAAHGTKALRMEAWVDLSLPVPPLDEQAEVVDFLEQRLDRFDRLIGRTGSSIELLHERRAALITAAVTGQIDVRSGAALAEESEPSGALA